MVLKNHATAIAVKHDCARSPQQSSHSSIPFFSKTRHSQTHAVMPKQTATILSGTYESYTASRFGIRTTPV